MVVRSLDGDLEDIYIRFWNSIKEGEYLYFKIELELK